MTYVHDMCYCLSNRLCIVLSLHPKLCRIHAINSRLTQLMSLAMRIQQEADHLSPGKDCSPRVCPAPSQNKLSQGLAMKACPGKASVAREQSTPHEQSLPGERWSDLLLNSHGKADHLGQAAVDSGYILYSLQPNIVTK